MVPPFIQRVSGVESEVKKSRTVAYGEEFLLGPEWDKMREEELLVLSQEGNPIGSLRQFADVWERHGCSNQVLKWMREGTPILLREKPKSMKVAELKAELSKRGKQISP